MIKFEALNAAKNTAKNSKNKVEENISIVLNYLKEYPSARQKDIMDNLNLSRRTLERVISFLKEKKYIERIGNNRSGSWKVLK